MQTKRQTTLRAYHNNKYTLPSKTAPRRTNATSSGKVAKQKARATTPLQALTRRAMMSQSRAVALPLASHSGAAFRQRGSPERRKGKTAQSAV